MEGSRTASGPMSRVERQSTSSTVPSTMKGSFGMPGSRPTAKIAPAAMRVAFGRPVT